MTISQRIRSQLFCLPTVSATASPVTAATTVALAVDTPRAERTASVMDTDAASVLIRLPLTRPIPGARRRASRAKACAQRQLGLGWSDAEHDRFLRGLELFPTGPWKEVAAFVGTRTTRQVMTHAQKYRQKIARRARGLQTSAARKSSAAAMNSKSTDELSKCCEMTTPSTASETRATHIESLGASAEPQTADLATSLWDSTLLCSADEMFSQFALLPHSSGVSARTDTEDSDELVPVPMTLDEWRLVDELAAAVTTTTYTTWTPSAFDEVGDAMCFADAVDCVTDPLALMFQDPSTVAYTTSKTAPVNAYFAPWLASMPAAAVAPGPAKSFCTDATSSLPYDYHL